MRWHKADLRDANLSKANFKEVDLSRADFKETDLMDTKLWKAIIEPGSLTFKQQTQAIWTDTLPGLSELP
jgi:uncharacterized protein YjbI with pentapeptide repeats